MPEIRIQQVIGSGQAAALASDGHSPPNEEVNHRQVQLVSKRVLCGSNRLGARGAGQPKDLLPARAISLDGREEIPIPKHDTGERRESRAPPAGKGYRSIIRAPAKVSKTLAKV
jgi:hypothetical protein